MEFLERLISCPSDFTPPEFHNVVGRLSNQSGARPGCPELCVHQHDLEFLDIRSLSVHAVRQSIKESAERLRSTIRKRNDSIASIRTQGGLQPISEQKACHGECKAADVQMTVNLAYAQTFSKLLQVLCLAADVHP